LKGSTGTGTLNTAGPYSLGFGLTRFLGNFLSYCQKMPQQSLELGPSSVTVRKCPNNVSNWGLLRLLSKNASTMPRNGNFLSYCQKMPKHCLKLGPSSVTVRKCLNNASNWGLPQLLSGNAPKCLELGPSSVTVRKCLNNASNWGLPQLLSGNV